MDPINIIIYVAVFCLIAWGAYYIITKFFPEPIRMVALVVVGVVLLIALLEVARDYLPLGGGLHHEAVIVR